MKVVITGHTSGIGKAIYEHFQSKDYEVIGMSRSNGYNIIDNKEKIIKETLGCDLFINNACDKDGQLELLKSLYNKVPKIITMGSIITEFPELYHKTQIEDKIQLEQFSKNISLINDDQIAKTFFIKISFAERTYNSININRVNSDYIISYKEITNIIDFWLENTNIREVEFVIKLTNITMSEIKKNVDKELFNQCLEKFNKFLKLLGINYLKIN
jgi:Glu-tRNA(Gln) amidotransferase subunit E-like FAD-binding protein